MAFVTGWINLVLNGKNSRLTLATRNANLKKQTYKPIYLKIMIENKWAYAAVISMVLAKTAPSKEKQEACLEEVEDSRKNLIYEIEKEIIKEAKRVSELNKRDKRIFEKKHFLNKTYKEIAKEEGISFQRVSQIDNRSIDNLKSQLKNCYEAA